jgi:predicted nucleic acid-binding protein
MPTSIPTSSPVSGERRPSGILDTSVVIDLRTIPIEDLPIDMAISTVTLAELSAGPLAAADPLERAHRQETLQIAEATFDALPFDAASARAFALIDAAVRGSGRKARGGRALDLLIAATARANRQPLYTRNAKDLRGLDGLVGVIEV